MKIHEFSIFLQIAQFYSSKLTSKTLGISCYLSFWDISNQMVFFKTSHQTSFLINPFLRSDNFYLNLCTLVMVYFFSDICICHICICKSAYHTNSICHWLTVQASKNDRTKLNPTLKFLSLKYIVKEFKAIIVQNLISNTW